MPGLRKLIIVAIGTLAAGSGAALAGAADIVAVEIAETGPRIYRFDVTVRHQDSGWEHYADRWEVVAPGGRILATRVLLHPHVGEQPFTRSLRGVEIGPGISEVRIRAHDNVHAFGGGELVVRLDAIVN